LAGVNKHPEYWGKYTFYAHSETINVLQFFNDKTIAYYSESSVEVRYVKLADGLVCLIDEDS